MIIIPAINYIDRMYETSASSLKINFFRQAQI